MDGNSILRLSPFDDVARQAARIVKKTFDAAEMLGIIGGGNRQLLSERRNQRIPRRDVTISRQYLLEQLIERRTETTCFTAQFILQGVKQPNFPAAPRSRHRPPSGSRHLREDEVATLDEARLKIHCSHRLRTVLKLLIVIGEATTTSAKRTRGLKCVRFWN